MSDVFTLTIDGKDVAGNEGQTVMEVAEENGIDIPGLCHLEGITDRGACRLCMVEIAGSPKLAAACMTKIAEGMAITAHSDKQGAAPTYKRGFGFHPLLAYLDHGPGGTGMPLAGMLRPGIFAPCCQSI